MAGDKKFGPGAYDKPPKSAVTNGDPTAGALFDRIARYEDVAERVADPNGDSQRSADQADHTPGADERVDLMLQYLACSLSNAVNFVRPNRLVLVSEMTRYPAFNDKLLRTIRSGILFELVDRVRIDVWDQPGAVSAETAGWLALAGLYQEGWNSA